MKTQHLTRQLPKNERILAEIFVMARGMGVHFDRTTFKARENLSDGGWVKHYFPQMYARAFTFYQNDFWNWTNTIEKDEKPRPRIECEPRGVGKSTSARGAVVKLLAEQKKFYILYICATDNQAQKHFNAIRAMLENENLLNDYPHLKPQAQKHRPNVAKNWSSERLVTEAGQVVEFISLLGNARGFTTEEGKRPDMFVLDDIDDSKDSPHIVNKKLEILKYSILPARGANTLILFPQNLIHRNSICQQIRDGRADILSDRIFVGAFALLKWYDAEKIDLNDGTGAKRWVITAGEAVDEAVPIVYCEELLNEMGKDAFERECQQEVFKVSDDKDFREYDEVYHIITYSEFLATFLAYKCDVMDGRGNIKLPHRWHVGDGLDWGTTAEHPSANISVTRPDKTTPLNDCHIVFAEVVLPKFPPDSHNEPELVSPGRVADAINQRRREWGILDSQIEKSVMSHEASAALNTFLVDLSDDRKVFFRKWKAQRGSGVPQIQNLLEIDRTKPHPFRRYPSGYKIGGVDVSGQRLMGRPRKYLLVPDEQGELFVDMEGKLRVRGAKDAKGLARLRFEIPLYSYRNTGQNKIDDDAVDGWRGLEASFGVESDDLTERERIEKAISERSPLLTTEAIKERSVAGKGISAGAQMARLEEESRARRELDLDEPDDFGFGFGGY